MTRIGVLSDQDISDLIEAETISALSPIPEANIQPASLDLRLGEFAYRLPASVLPGKSVKVHEILDEFSMHKMSLENGAVLEKNCVYIVPLMESLKLPSEMDAIANAKSTTGRLDVFTRLITDYGVEFDRVPKGYIGPLFAEVSPRSFSVLVRPGMRLNQIRFRIGQTALNDQQIKKLHTNTPLVNTKPHIDDGLGFSVDLSNPSNQAVGYRARPHTGLIDLDLIDHYNVEDYWDKVYAQNGRIILDPGAFYILASREEVTIPAELACEMAPYVAMVGEFRVHYAGFFDPGFGMNETGGAGSRGVLEVRCHEAPFVLNDGQRVGRLVFEQMNRVPQKLYGTPIGSNYQAQGLKLAKQFKQSI